VKGVRPAALAQDFGEGAGQPTRCCEIRALLAYALQQPVILGFQMLGPTQD
jgi:hypothetical protein